MPDIWVMLDELCYIFCMSAPVVTLVVVVVLMLVPFLAYKSDERAVIVL